MRGKPAKSWFQFGTLLEGRPRFTAFLPLPPPPVLHENQLTHTDLKPENILFVNSEFETLYNEHKVGHGGGGRGGVHPALE